MTLNSCKEIPRAASHVYVQRVNSLGLGALGLGSPVFSLDEVVVRCDTSITPGSGGVVTKVWFRLLSTQLRWSISSYCTDNVEGFQHSPSMRTRTPCSSR